MDLESDKYIITGKALERYFDFNDALLEFHRLFTYDEKDDRSIAIIGGTFLEISLEHILRAFLPENDNEVEKLFEFNNALGNFSSKISMVYSLGLIEKVVKDDLHLARKIRNEFAHDLYATFESENIGSWCRSLMWHRKAFVANPPESATNRDLYQVGVNQLITHLSGCVSIARDNKREIRNNF